MTTTIYCGKPYGMDFALLTVGTELGKSYTLSKTIMKKRDIKKLEILIKDNQYQYCEYILNESTWIKSRIKSFKSIEKCLAHIRERENIALQKFYDVDITV
jgi:hypothetical protein